MANLSDAVVLQKKIIELDQNFTDGLNTKTTVGRASDELKEMHDSRAAWIEHTTSRAPPKPKRAKLSTNL